MVQLESKSPRELSYKLRENIGVTLLQVHLEHQGRRIPITTVGLEILSQLESERAYEELIRPGPPYRSGNLDNLRRSIANLDGREHAEKELIPLGLIEIDPKGESIDVYHLSAIARESKYLAIVR